MRWARATFAIGFWSIAVAWATAPTASAALGSKPPAAAPAPRAFPGRWLDAASGHRLTGVSRDDAPENSDLPDLLSVFREGTLLGRFRDARFAPSRHEALIAIDERHRLVRIDADRNTHALDRDAQPGFDVSAACGCVVYVRGHGSGAELVRVAISGGAPVVLASDEGSAWLPVISPTGREVAFLSDRTGFGSWWVVPMRGGAARQLTNLNARSVSELGPAPEGPDRPVWAGGWLVFEHDGVTHAVSATDGKIAWSRAALGPPRWHDRDRSLAFGEGRALPVDEALRAGAR